MSFRGTTLRNIITLVSAVFLLLAIFFYFNHLRPTLAEIKNLNSDLKSKKFVLSNIEIKAEALRLAINNLEASGTDQRLHSAIPDGADSANLLNTVNTLANRTSISINGLSFSLSPGDRTSLGFGEATDSNAISIKSLNKLGVSFKAVGSYSNLKSFLGLLATNLRIIDLDNMKLVPLDENPNLIEVDLHIKAYFY